MPDPDTGDAAALYNYFFDRYLHTLTRVFLLGLIIPAVLLPLNLIDGQDQQGSVQGLDRLSFSNIAPSHTDRYWAHLVLAAFAALVVCLILRREIQDYHRLQSKASDQYAKASSLLVVSHSKKPPSAEAIWKRFNTTSGGVRSVVVNRDYSSVRAKVRKRDESVERLEVAETKLIIKANRQNEPLDRAADKDTSDAPLWTSYLDKKDRGLMHLPIRSWLPALPFIGPEVDEIYHLRAQVARLNLEIESAQRNPDKFPESNSALVSFNERLETPLAALALKTQVAPSWTLKHGTTPGDMIWQNVSISGWEKSIRGVFVYLLIAALTLGFAIPVAIAGSLSQIKYLASAAVWLHWILGLPGWTIAAVQGVLPQAIVSLIAGLVPTMLRFLAKRQGFHSRQVLENHVQIYYFTFLFVQVFLTVSLSAGFATIVGQMDRSVKSVPLVLAQNLPKASNYFFSYIMIYTFTTVAHTLLQLGSFIQLYLLSPWLDATPRRIWARRESLDRQEWGTLIPMLTNIACIGTFLEHI